MPFVNIKITRDGVTPEKKAEVIRRVTQVMVDVLGKNPATTMVLIEEVETDNWGVAGGGMNDPRRGGTAAFRG